MAQSQSLIELLDEMPARDETRPYCGDVKLRLQQYFTPTFGELWTRSILIRKALYSSSKMGMPFDAVSVFSQKRH
jgi:hypothetical protein